MIKMVVAVDIAAAVAVAATTSIIVTRDDNCDDLN